MLKTTLTAARLQLHYHHEDPDAHHLCFPSTDGLLDHKQVHACIWWKLCVILGKFHHKQRTQKCILNVCRTTFKACIQKYFGMKKALKRLEFHQLFTTCH